MKRRNFGKVLTTGAILGTSMANNTVLGSVTSLPTVKPQKNILMRVGGDDHSVKVLSSDAISNSNRSVKEFSDSTSKENLEFKLRHGVKHITTHVRKFNPDGSWDIDEMKRMKDNCDNYGVELECLNLGDTLETHVEKQRTPNITLGKSPERDREVEVILGNIRKAGEVAIPAIRYHWRILPIMRSGYTQGRGGSLYRRWDIEDNWQDLPMSKAGRVTQDVWWERITWFLERVIPVAEEYKVRMACHLPDPPLPIGYRGVDRWNHNVFEGLKKYSEIVNSPYNGFLLCVGTVGEGMLNPGKDVYDIIRYLGEQNKIFCVHLRNINGTRDHFSEVYPDEGDMDFYKIVRILRDVQYPYSILPDHMPDHPEDPRKWQAFAFGYGYIKGLIQAVNSEV